MWHLKLCNIAREGITKQKTHIYTADTDPSTDTEHRDRHTDTDTDPKHRQTQTQTQTEKLTSLKVILGSS